jgi:hypothetical protein
VGAVKVAGAGWGRGVGVAGREGGIWVEMGSMLVGVMLLVGHVRRGRRATERDGRSGG